MISPMLLKEVSKLITQRLGIQIREQDLERLRATLSNRCDLRGLPDLSRYLQFLNSPGAAAKDEWNELATLLTTGETFFFRDQGQADLLRQVIFPELIARRRNERRLRIWSAGCSTGEEPYSLVIMLSELLPDLQNWKLYMLATDINAKALATAQQGKYSGWSFRGMDPHIFPRYFQKQGERWEVAEHIKKMVTFKTKNLLTDEYPNAATGDMDLIVCRNVFIYFGADHISEIVNRFADCLRPDGYLLTGHGELQRVASIPLRTCVHSQSVVYQRRGPTASRTTDLAKKPLAETRQTATPVTTMPVKTVLPEIGQQPSGGQPAASNQAEAVQIQAIETLLQQGNQAAAARAAEKLVRDFPHDERAIMILARARADQAMYNEAIEDCQRAIKINSFAVAPRYLLAHIAEEQGRHEDAKDLLKKIIYLDPEHLGAHLDLATFHAKSGNLDQAKKLRQRVIEILKQAKDDQMIQVHGQITAGQLRQELMKQLGL